MFPNFTPPVVRLAARLTIRRQDEPSTSAEAKFFLTLYLHYARVLDDDFDRTIGDAPDRSLDLLEHAGKIAARGVSSCLIGSLLF
jgi:hypothetical protein